MPLQTFGIHFLGLLVVLLAVTLLVCGWCDFVWPFVFLLFCDCPLRFLDGDLLSKKKPPNSTETDTGQKNFVDAK